MGNSRRSRTTYLFALGLAMTLAVVALGVVALQVGRAYFTNTDQSTAIMTPTLAVGEVATSTSHLPTGTSPSAVPFALTGTARAQYTQPTRPPGGNPPPTGVAAACTDRATLISDVTVPDGTQFVPNAGFNKIWRVQNSGTCTWDTSYRLVHTGGHLLGAVSPYFPLRDTVFPGRSTDLLINMVSPTTPATYQSDWKLQNPQGQVFGVGRNSSPVWVKIVVLDGVNATISGVVYQDSNQNGVYDSGEALLGSHVVWLIPGTACHVRQDAIATAISESNGRFTLTGYFSGSYCVGLAGDGGLDDVASVNLVAGQTLDNINLRGPVPTGSVSGYVWNDYCLTDENGNALDGDCVMGDNGDYQADAMIQPTETYIAGVTVHLQTGSCSNNTGAPLTAVTDANGRYFFGNVGQGSHCVSLNPTSPENASRLSPGDFTFPGRGIWRQDVSLLANQDMFPINFGWDSG